MRIFLKNKRQKHLGSADKQISNRENEKTFPDIVSVVKMSDLYHISLDHLLKEETAVKSYLNYLEESTNTVKRKNKFSAIILTSTYFGIWTISLVAFWLFGREDALGYAIMVFYGVLPITTFIISFLIGKNNYWGKWKWIFAIVSGVMYMLADYSTFSASNMIAFDKLNMPQLTLILAGTLISLFGMCIGYGLYLLNARKRSK